MVLGRFILLLGRYTEVELLAQQLSQMQVLLRTPNVT